MGNYIRFGIILAGCFTIGRLVGLFLINPILLDPSSEQPEIVPVYAVSSSCEHLIPCDITEIHDADTFKCVIRFPWGIQMVDSVRSLGYDAWEVTKTRRSVKVTDEEVRKGKIALEAFRTFLKDKPVYLSPENDKGTRDPYGRILAFVRVQDGETLVRMEDWMCTHGHCRRD